MNLKNMIAGTLIGIVSFFPVKAESQVNGNIKYLQTAEKESVLGSYVEAKALYKLPGNINGFSFVDFYKNERGYFGKTNLTKSLKGGLSAKVQNIYVNEPFTEAYLGFNYRIGEKDKYSISVDVLPVVINSEKDWKQNQRADYSVRANLPYDMTISNFGSWKFERLENPEWTFGELNITKHVGEVNFGYSGALNSDGDAAPTLEHRVSIGVNF